MKRKRALLESSAAATTAVVGVTDRVTMGVRLRALVQSASSPAFLPLQRRMLRASLTPFLKSDLPEASRSPIEVGKLSNSG